MSKIGCIHRVAEMDEILCFVFDLMTMEENRVDFSFASFVLCGIPRYVLEILSKLEMKALL